MIETHPLAPFLPINAKLLILGSFPPPQKRWKMNFYYPNYQNDMWKIFGLCFFKDAFYFLDVKNKCFYEDKIREFLTEKGIAIYDSAYQVTRLKGNASDQFLKIETVTDVPALLKHIPACEFIMTTGEKATNALMQSLPKDTPKPTLSQPSHCQIEQRTLYLYRLLSSSRAYPLALDKKAEHYANFFNIVGLI